ncbi:MAG TPA: glycosyltransferase family 1 protein [Vicinamibacterales bacterium]|nr:glycosyltransferase family 1 protein [Vicinamibacterales bacterium]
MRILLDYRPALRNRTGVGEFAHHMAAALARRGGAADRVTLFSSSWKDRLPADRVPGATTLDGRVPVSVLNLAWHRFGWPPVELMGGRADVAWSLHPLLMPSRTAAQVVTIHDLYFLDHSDATDREVRRDYPALVADHARRADAIIVVSEYTRDQVIERLRVPIEKITVCSPGAPAWAPRVEPAGVGPILHVGSLEPRKNIPALVQAYLELVREHDDTPPLVLAGQGNLPLLLPAADSELMRTHVRVLGYVSDEDRLGLYREASMVVMASTDEGFGIPALEAMTLGVPVVASSRGSLPEVVGDAGLLVDPDDRQAFAAAMRRVLDEPALRRDLARRGIERSGRFSWDTSAARAREAFEGALRARKARP